jgi:hypothetical protein
LDALLDAVETVQLGGAPVDGAGTADFEFRRRRIQEYFATRHVLKHPSKVAPQRLLTDERGRETAVTLLQTAAPGCCRSLYSAGFAQNNPRRISRTAPPLFPCLRVSVTLRRLG